MIEFKEIKSCKECPTYKNQLKYKANCYLCDLWKKGNDKIENILDFLQDKIQVDGVFNKDNMEIYFNLSEKEKQELLKIINGE